LKKDTTIPLLEGLAEISKAIMEKRYLDDIFALIVSVTAKVTSSKICSILLLDKKRKELVLKACQSESGQYSQKSNTPLGKGIAGRVALRNEPIKVLDVRKELKFLNRRIAEEDGLVSLLSVPMSAEGEVIGVINCYTPKKHDFTTKEIHMLTTVASQAAILLNNTELRIMKELVERELEERKNIEKAKEIIMKNKKMSGDKAFELMRKHSMNTRTSLSKIADSIILAESINTDMLKK
jgi:signal transduction protein with GAF and PtsI domain